MIMVKNWLRAFFVVLILVGGLWWYWGWKQSKGTITKEASRVEVVSSPAPKPKPEKETVEEEHQPVEAGVSDWQLGLVILGSLGMGVLMWGLYKATYSLYWLD